MFSLIAWINIYNRRFSLQVKYEKFRCLGYYTALCKRAYQTSGLRFVKIAELEIVGKCLLWQKRQFKCAREYLSNEHLDPRES